MVDTRVISVRDEGRETTDFRVDSEREITTSERVAIRPNWNGDGGSIVFEVKEGSTSKLFSRGLSQVCVMRRDGSHLQQLTFDSVPSKLSAWSSTGDRLVLVRGDPRPTTLQAASWSFHWHM